MANPFFGAFNRGPMMQNPMAMLQQVRANPMQFARNLGYNSPDGMANNPEQIVRHLVQSGQFNPQQMQQYQQMVGGNAQGAQK